MAWKVAIGQVCPLHNHKIRRSNDDGQSSSHRRSALQHEFLMTTQIRINYTYNYSKLKRFHCQYLQCVPTMNKECTDMHNGNF